MIKKYEADFNVKINHFSSHPKYAWLRAEADKALHNHTGYGSLAIVACDFMDRIIAMPLDYIEDWLNGENELKWRDCDKKRLSAMKMGCEHLYEMYPESEICLIRKEQKDFYSGCGYTLFEDVPNRQEFIYAIKHKEVN